MTEKDIPGATSIFSAVYGSADDRPSKLFISGHSLTDRPFPDFLAALAAREGHSLEWYMQHLEGSSLRRRTQGDGSVAWCGYRQGTDRDQSDFARRC